MSSDLAHRHGTGAFHRRHLLVATDASTVVAGMEDEMHRFELVLHHDGERVTAVWGRPVRWPWTPCAEAHRALEAMVGVALTTSAGAIGRAADARQQCTHQFDLAALAVAHALRHRRGGSDRRDYRAEVPDWHQPPYEASLVRDGREVLRWVVGDGVVEGPEPFDGVSLRGGFLRWCEQHLDADGAEAAHVLRRAVWMAPARRLDLEAHPDVRASGLAEGVCYATQPERLALARRNRGSLRDYGRTPEVLLAGFRASPGDYPEGSSGCAS